jgi:hypothetical protein
MKTQTQLLFFIAAKTLDNNDLNPSVSSAKPHGTAACTMA